MQALYLKVMILKDFTIFTYMIPDEIKIKPVKPVLSGYISEALRLLKNETFPDEDSVHDIRVLMKKARATVKLVAHQIDSEFFEREYMTFREAGRLLAEWRETSVHRKTLKSIRKSHEDLFSRLSGYPFLGSIMATPLEFSSPGKAESDRIEKIEEILRKSLYRVRFQSFSKQDFRLMFQALESTYNEVAGIYLECRRKPRPGKIHSLRKRAKDLLYQLWFFRPLNPPVIKRIEKRLDTLTRDIGKYNDLEQLLKVIGYEPGNPENPPDINELLIIIRDKQHNYLSDVWSEAYRLFCPGQKLVNLLGFRLLSVDMPSVVKIR
ncbi:MAG: CHAD domain-containing protein [Bacteroidales bacterium]